MKTDKSRLSSEEYEIDYVKKIARKYLEICNKDLPHSRQGIRTSQLKRLCQFALKRR
jgi:hypothetical protein